MTMLPMVAMILQTITYACNERIIRYATLIISPMWLIYDIYTGSYSGILTEIFVLCSVGMVYILELQKNPNITVREMASKLNFSEPTIRRDYTELARRGIITKAYGGVIPELASRAHQVNIVPVVSEAITRAGIKPSDITAIAFTRGPGLLGSLLVGTSFAKGLAMSLGKPLVEVNHLQGHILANFIKQTDSENRQPEFPYLCLLVSGGNSQIVRVDSPLEYEILGQTIDDAVGEAFDKCSKMMGLGYPGGPIVDRLAKEGDPLKYKFSKPHIPGLDYSFSGIKTSLLYFVRDQMAIDPEFMEKNKADICASFQKALIDILMDKLIKAAKQTGIRQITIGGGVSANSGLRSRIEEEGRKRGWTTFLPEFKFTTDNAAMIAIAGWFHYMNGERSSLDVAPVSRLAEF